jgi:YD repeat-containing protein
LTGVTDEEGVAYATIGYDGAGRAVSSALAGGVDSYSTTYVDPPLIATADVYDPVNHIVVRTRSWQAPTGLNLAKPNGSISELSAISLQGMNRLTRQSQPAGSGCDSSTSDQTYDANGNVASRDDFNGKRTCYAYDTTRNLQTVRVEGLEGGADGADCSEVTSSAAALPPGSRKITSSWHPQWPLTSQKAEPGRLTTYVYNGQPDPMAADGVIAECAPPTAVLHDSSPIAVLCKQVEQATTDASGAKGLAATVDVAVPARVLSYSYNASGQLLSAKGPRTDVDDTTHYAYYTDTSFIGTGPDATGHTQGDLAQMTNAARQVTRYTLYNPAGQVLEWVDPNGVISSLTYDPRQRVVSSGIGGLTTRFEYGLTGLIKKATRPDGSWQAYHYDDAHRLISIGDNLGNSIEYTLDNLGNRTAEQVRDSGNALRRSISRGIDPLGRVQNITGRE